MCVLHKSDVCVKYKLRYLRHTSSFLINLVDADADADVGDDDTILKPKHHSLTARLNETYETPAVRMRVCAYV